MKLTSMNLNARQADRQLRQSGNAEDANKLEGAGRVMRKCLAQVTCIKFVLQLMALHSEKNVLCAGAERRGESPPPLSYVGRTIRRQSGMISAR